MSSRQTVSCFIDGIFCRKCPAANKSSRNIRLLVCPIRGFAVPWLRKLSRWEFVVLFLHSCAAILSRLGYTALLNANWWNFVENMTVNTYAQNVLKDPIQHLARPRDDRCPCLGRKIGSFFWEEASSLQEKPLFVWKTSFWGERQGILRLFLHS